MKLNFAFITLLLSFSISGLSAQSTMVETEEQQIIATINNYIIGTSFSYPDRLKEAFMPEANMFLDHPDKPLFLVKIERYATNVAKSEAGVFNGRVTNILNIDRFEGIATAKLEVTVPSVNKRYIDLLLLKKLEDGWKIISKTAGSETRINQPNKALLVLSNAAYQGDSDLAAGNSFSEVIIAYDGYQKAGYHVDIVSPLGGAVPLAYINAADSLQRHYLYDADFMYALEHTSAPADIDPNVYDIIQFTGGSAPIHDIPQHKEIQEIAMHIYEKNKGVIAAVCHGTAAIVNLQTSDGKYLVAGKNVNGYPDAHENKKSEHYKLYPFIIEDVLEERGATFKHSESGTPHMEVAERLVTGQNWLSSDMVTKKSIAIKKELDATRK